MGDLTELQKQVSDTMHEKGWNPKEIQHESPAIERVIADIQGVKPPRYSKTVQPVDGSYLSASARHKPALANRLADNLSQRVMRSLAPVRGKVMQNPVESAAQIALGAKSVEKSQALYNMLGLLDKFYGNDVIESRYSLSAQMYAQYLQQPNKSNPGESAPAGDVTEDFGQGHSDLSDHMSMFQEWIETAEPFFRLISKHIDRTMNPVNTSRIKHTRIEDEDGDHTDLEQLDLAQFSKISSESLQTFAASPQLTGLFLDEMTMEIKYRHEMRRYIDVFVVDQSGSMAGYHILRAAAFIFNRLEKVEKGDAMVAIMEFDTAARMYNIPKELAEDKPRWLIDTKKKAQWAMKNVVRKYVSMAGGGTDIPVGVKAGVELAYKMEEYGGVMPNITVVTDDDTSISSLDPKTLPMPVNGLALKGNTYLQNFCVATGGMYNNLEQITLNVRNLE